MTRLLLAAVLVVVGVGFTSASTARQPILKNLKAAPAADPNRPPPTRPCPDPPCFDPSAGKTPTAFLVWVGRDVERFWRTRITAVPSGRWVKARQLVVAPGRKYRSACYAKGVTAKTGLSYCATDKPPTVYLPLDRARTTILGRRNWQGWRRRDFAFAYAVAHEWAHHAQKTLNLLQDRELRALKIELQADCLAGYWAHSVWARELLDEGDIAEAIALARLVGDAPGSPKNDPKAHGTAAQREQWFKRGYLYGDASHCIVD